jgi:DNA-binding transcriptional LysR family regulator
VPALVIVAIMLRGCLPGGKVAKDQRLRANAETEISDCHRRHMIEVRDLRLVLEIHRQGSLVKAARVLNVGQPALTRSLAALEGRLRGPLFERHRQGVIPTNLGRALLAEAEDILGRLDRVERGMAEVRGGQVRDLSIMAGTYVLESIGMAAAMRMLPLYPRVRLKLQGGNWAEVPRALHAREATLGLLDLRGAEPDAGLEVEPLRRQPGIFVVRAGHPLTRLPAVGLPDILSWPLLFISRAPQAVQGPMAAAREAARAAGTPHAAFPALMHESPTVALAALRHGDAVAALTLSVALPALRAGMVAALPWREPWVSVHPGVIRLRGRPAQEAEQAYLDLLRDADAEAEREARAWCAENGISAECA